MVPRLLPPQLLYLITEKRRATIRGMADSHFDLDLQARQDGLRLLADRDDAPARKSRQEGRQGRFAGLQFRVGRRPVGQGISGMVWVPGVAICQNE